MLLWGPWMWHFVSLAAWKTYLGMIQIVFIMCRSLTYLKYTTLCGLNLDVVFMGVFTVY